MKGIKGRFISKTFNNFNRLNHHWPKILTNLNSYFSKVVKIQIGENFRSVVVQTIEIVKGFRDKSTFNVIRVLPELSFNLYKLKFKFWIGSNYFSDLLWVKFLKTKILAKLTFWSTMEGANSQVWPKICPWKVGMLW